MMIDGLILSLLSLILLGFSWCSLFHDAILLILELGLPLPFLVEVHDHIGLTLRFSELLLSVSIVYVLPFKRLHVYLYVLLVDNL